MNDNPSNPSDYEIEEDDIVFLEDESGNQVEFVIVEALEYEEREFIVCVPRTEFNADSEEYTAVVCELVTSEEGEETLQVVEDEKLASTIISEAERLAEEDGESGAPN